MEGGMSAPTEPWAMVPERVAYLGLDATALDVFIILSSKAGRSREAWITQKTIGERLRKHRTTIGRTIKRLEREGVVRDTGSRVPVGDPPVWVKKYEVAPFTRSDLREVRSRRTPGEGEVRLDGHEVRLGTDEVRPGRTQSSASKAVPLNKEISDEELNTEHVPNNPWCRCPDCRNPEEQTPHREEEPESAIEVVAPEEVMSHG
jgi:hypothetical protein